MDVCMVINAQLPSGQVQLWVRLSLKGYHRYLKSTITKGQTHKGLANTCTQANTLPAVGCL